MPDYESHIGLHIYTHQKTNKQPNLNILCMAKNSISYAKIPLMKWERHLQFIPQSVNIFKHIESF